MRTSWIGPVGLPPADAARLHAVLRKSAAHLGPAWRWGLVGMFAGTLPLLLSWVSGLAWWSLPTSIGLAMLMIAASADRRGNVGLVAVGCGMFAHCAVAISLTTVDPVGMAAMLPDGAAYWDKTLRWVQTGESPEYQLSWWVPAHFQLIAATALLSYVSLGITALHEGFYEVGLMNYYVGSLVSRAEHPVRALLVGWHPWSVARGLGFLMVCQEVVDLSLGRLLGTSLSTPRQRRLRWGLGLAFLGLDALIKLLFLDTVRLAILGAL